MKKPTDVYQKAFYNRLILSFEISCYWPGIYLCCLITDNMKIHLHFIVVIVLHSIQADITGLITLDSLSFNKTLRAFPYSFIKFDTISPSGPKHETFLTLVKDLLEVEKIFLADVHIPGK